MAAIQHSDLRPSVRKVVEELITGKGKLRRPSHRPPSEDRHMKGLYRALCVLDLEAAGWDKRDAAIKEAEGGLHLSYSTIEKAVLQYEGLIESFRTTNPEVLDYIRAAVCFPKLLNLNANLALAGVNGSGKSNST